jgi:hypothetical protein
MLFVLFLFGRLVTKLFIFIQKLPEALSPSRNFDKISTHNDVCIFSSYFVSSQSCCKNLSLKHYVKFRNYSRWSGLEEETDYGTGSLPPATQFTLITLSIAIPVPLPALQL